MNNFENNYDQLQKVPLLEGIGLTKVFANQPAIKDVNIKIGKNIFFGISGPSGCGKTTLLSLLALLDKPDSGQIIFNNQFINNLDENKSAIIRNSQFGFVFQSSNMLMHLSVLENLLIPFDYGEKVERQLGLQRASKMLEKVNMSGFESKKINTLSGGEQQRIGIARALMRDPVVIFADEPTGNLDRINTQLVLEILKNLSRQQDKSVVMVSHDPFALSFCDEVFNMQKH